MHAIQGLCHLLVRDEPIDCGAAVGQLCSVQKASGPVHDVYRIAKERSHFGIYAGWDQGRTYVACSN